MDGVMDLVDVLAELRAEAATLRLHGHAHDAALLEQTVDRVREAAGDHVTWLTEDDAMLRSGRSRGYLRARFAEWERDGHAKRDGRRRRYRACAIARRANLAAARDAARRAVHGSAA